MLIIIGFPMMEKGVNMDIKQEVLSRGGGADGHRNVLYIPCGMA